VAPDDTASTADRNKLPAILYPLLLTSYTTKCCDRAKVLTFLKNISVKNLLATNKVTSLCGGQKHVSYIKTD
jgi:hypothetical protein